MFKLSDKEFLIYVNELHMTLYDITPEWYEELLTNKRIKSEIN